MSYSYICIYVCVCVCVCVYPFMTLWTVAHQAPLSMRFPRQKYWSGLPFPTPRDLPDPGMEPTSPVSSTLAGDFFTTEPSGKLSSVQSLSRVLTLYDPTDCSVSGFPVPLYLPDSLSSLKLMFIESLMPSNYLILCHPLLLMPSIFPSITVFSNGSAHLIR